MHTHLLYSFFNQTFTALKELHPSLSPVKDNFDFEPVAINSLQNVSTSTEAKRLPFFCKQKKVWRKVWFLGLCCHSEKNVENRKVVKFLTALS